MAFNAKQIKAMREYYLSHPSDVDVEIFKDMMPKFKISRRTLLTLKKREEWERPLKVSNELPPQSTISTIPSSIEELKTEKGQKVLDAIPMELLTEELVRKRVRAIVNWIIQGLHENDIHLAILRRLENLKIPDYGKYKEVKELWGDFDMNRLPDYMVMADQEIKGCWVIDMEREISLYAMRMDMFMTMAIEAKKPESAARILTTKNVMLAKMYEINRPPQAENIESFSNKSIEEIDAEIRRLEKMNENIDNGEYPI